MRVLLAGESWVSAVTDYKGYDAFPHAQVEIGCAELLAALAEAGHHVTHLRSHDVAEQFPSTLAELDAYDVVILSDIGSNSLLLPPVVFAQGRPAPNRLKLLAEWVRRGGGLAMAGGYLSFQGFQGRANYHRTAVEDVLPVRISPYDDRVETPEGIGGTRTAAEHPVTAGLERDWPILLGYQRLEAREDATVLATIEDAPLLLVRTVGRGRTLAFASDISPHWAPREFMDWDGYGRLFDQAVRWLAGEDAEPTSLAKAGAGR
ncbi:glutamine amidotransferase [Georgenia sp. SYP-B2076]|uniref:glutamine amidotransferase n=1 Tax=Georgenia sp. SYP-B2076 TaxID=2495881 RepID=UPI001F0C80FA|nr:glutamine amidotransferase [Georgenia sp. SYP-B2076]